MRASVIFLCSCIPNSAHRSKFDEMLREIRDFCRFCANAGTDFWQQQLLRTVPMTTDGDAREGSPSFTFLSDILIQFSAVRPSDACDGRPLTPRGGGCHETMLRL